MKSEVLYKTPKTLLNKGTGFLNGYSHTLNPYTGCTFACSYCYVRQMPVSIFRNGEWGSWVDVKLESAAILRKELKRVKTKGPVTIFMSSSTDPYQPVEAKEQVTRALLEVMVGEPPDFLFVQTRSPLVRRDIDLLQQLGDRVRVSMTVETDREDIRKHFTPSAPPVQARLKTLELLRDAGIPTQAAIAPVLPSTAAFPEILRPLVNRVCIDDYFMGDGSGGKRTKRLPVQVLYEELGLEEWYDPAAYQVVYDRFSQAFPKEQLFVSQQGFEP
ncbi:SPL family radical SAM protein [Paenibacillus glucanolyticus]|uniref:SPL family radical SAM protein n=1 Tax=Paenibacillus glucanolyticus TaxID=59843 RepID=UPI0012DBA625|nr:radical SAM protein [Paenibacillus glucanolyticus]MPY17789.1 radical SAM protein [Paenibacillus glucanolyticus]